MMKILVAEDALVSRHLLARHLRTWGHEVVAAMDGAEAWQCFVTQPFPMVISDWMMPKMDGLDLVRRIRASQCPGYVYIILLTAKSQTADLVEGMEAGADDFMTKPFERDELRVRLRAGERIIGLEQTLAQQNRELRETQAALIQSEKLASLGQLAAGMAHEINNPLAYVTNNLAVLHRDMQAAMEVLNTYRRGYENLAPFAQDLIAEATRMEAAIDLPYIQANFGRDFEASLQGLQRVGDIVNHLRDFARLDEAAFKAIDLTLALTSTIEIARYELRNKEIHLQTEFQALPPVPCHPSKLNQVFLNLLMNAIQASPSGGLIIVRTRMPTANTVEVEVEDHGHGIHAEHMTHLFEPFFTTKPVGRGMGLGLSVSYGIVRDHGGTIEVESTPGCGSLFRVRLALQPPRES
jgi:signal transduction histidine kinase